MRIIYVCVFIMCVYVCMFVCLLCVFVFVYLFSSVPVLVCISVHE